MDIEDFIDTELGALSIVPVQVNSQETEEHEDVLEEGYSKDSQQIARFLLTLKKPKGMTQGEFCAFWKCALKYAVSCIRWAQRMYLVRLSLKKQSKILKGLHEDCGIKVKKICTRR